MGGALYLGWLGLQALRHAGEGAGDEASAALGKSHRAFRDGMVVALGNPKSLVYIVALLPPFVDVKSAVVPQLVVLALVAMGIDVLVGALYIGAGSRLAAAMQSTTTRRKVDIAVGLIFLAIAAGILADIALR